jgi:hypothetical protein
LGGLVWRLTFFIVSVALANFSRKARFEKDRKEEVRLRNPKQRASKRSWLQLSGKAETLKS